MNEKLEWNVADKYGSLSLLFEILHFEYEQLLHTAQAIVLFSTHLQVRWR
jgi:hypothetical protein